MTAPAARLQIEELKDTIRISIAGKPTMQDMICLGDDLAVVVEKVRPQRHVIRILADIRELEMIDPRIEAAMLQTLRSLYFDKLAIILTNDTFAAMVQLLIETSNKRQQVHIFTEHDEAEAWLLKE